MIEIPYGAPGFLPVPLLTASTEDFKDAPTLAVGDMTVWTDEQIRANVGVYSSPFTAGRTKPAPGDVVYRAESSSQTGTVVAVVHSSGAWASTNAGGVLYIKSLSTGFSSGTIGINGNTSAAMQTTTSMVAGLLREIDAGHVALVWTSSETACRRGFFLLEDASTTPEWQDQSIPFITIGHPLAGNPFIGVPMPAGVLSSAPSGLSLEISSSGGYLIATTGQWTGGVVHLVKSGLEAAGEVGRSIVDSSSGGQLTLDPAFSVAPTIGWGVYAQPAPAFASSSGAFLPKVNTLRIAGSRITGIGTSSDPFDGSTDVV